MSRVIKRSASQAVKSGLVPPRHPPSEVHPSTAFSAGREAPSGPQWLHEIKLDGYRMAARIENGRAQLLTRTGLDWTDKYPSATRGLRM